MWLFSHQAVLHCTSWVSCNSIQSWHCLLGVSLWSHRVRAQSHRTLRQMLVASPRLLASEWLAMSWSSHDPLLGLIICENLGTTYIYQFRVKWYDKWTNTQVEGMDGASFGGRSTVLPCSSCHFCPRSISMCSAIWNVFEFHTFESFMEDSSHRGMISHELSH